MLYWLIALSDRLSVLNVFRYLTFRAVGAVVTALIFVFLFGPTIINLLRVKQGKGQPIRADGPESHLVTKKGTPTMGGLMILSGLLVSTLLWANLTNPYLWIALAVVLGFALIGLYDCFSGRARVIAEMVVAISGCYALAHLTRTPLATSLTFPLLSESVVDFGWIFIVFGTIIIVATGNAVSLGGSRAFVPVMATAAGFAVISYVVGNALLANYLQVRFVPGTGELAVVCAAAIGAGVGFLLLGAPRVKMDMGDTGLLALGALLGSVAIATKRELVLASFGLLFGLWAAVQPARS